MPRKHEPRISSAKEVHRKQYKECPFDDFLRLSQQNCHYCNCPPSRTWKIEKHNGKKISAHQIKYGAFTYNGLDRKDNSRNHAVDNVVTCCWPCNNMKGKMSYDEFVAYIKHINSNLCKRDSLFLLNAETTLSQSMLEACWNPTVSLIEDRLVQMTSKNGSTMGLLNWLGSPANESSESPSHEIQNLLTA